MTNKERMEKCNKCKVRKIIAKRVDCHFDYTDCPYNCEVSNDYEKEKKNQTSDN